MNKTPNGFFYIIAIISILALYFLLQPKISSILFEKKKSMLLDNFIEKTRREKRVDVQEFWKMREFYCPGSFVFDKSKNPFLIYSCKWMESEDYLIDNPTDTTFQINEKNNVLTIRFVVPSEEMKKAVGYFDYNEKDKELVKGKYWMDITTFFSQK